MNLKTKKIICLVVGIASILTIVSTVSYAYFTAMTDMKSVESVINTATVSVGFADYGDEVDSSLNFGESVTKKFTIENTGIVDASVRMSWVDLINTYLEGSLTYTLKYSNNEAGPYTEVIGKTNVPRSSSLSKRTLAKKLTVPVGETYYYTLEITLNYLSDVNQDADLYAVFNSKFGIEDINEKYYVTFDANGGTVGVTSKTITENEEYGTLPSPTRKNYEFLGWYTELESGTQITENSIVENSSNHTLYAHWRKLTIPEIMIASSHGPKATFDKAATTDEGIYEIEDDYGTSYYYRGAVKNNYVKFAGFYWRIIRLNGDGSLRIIYDGTSAHANGEASDDRFTEVSQPYNALNDDAKYVGWMYGPANAVAGTTTSSTSKAQAQMNVVSSDIKIVVDEWYKTNIKDRGFGEYVSDTLFCNDRSIPVTGYDWDTGLGYGKKVTAYAGFQRFIIYTKLETGGSYGGKQIQEAIFKCPQKNDAYTVADKKKGNGALTYPVGLLTGDERLAAGNKFGVQNRSSYLYKGGDNYWTMTPYNTRSNSIMFGVISISLTVSIPSPVAPVINLTPEYVNTMVGEGTMDNPYVGA